MSKYLLNYKLKFVGLALLILSFFLAIIRFYFGIKPNIFDTKVFAIYSYYFEKKYFVVIENHISEEIAGVLALTGLFLVAFSKEKNENDKIVSLRNNSMKLSFIANYIFLILSFVFVYGFAFLDIMIINIFSQLVFFIIIFRISVLINNRKT